MAKTLVLGFESLFVYEKYVKYRLKWGKLKIFPIKKWGKHLKK